MLIGFLLGAASVSASEDDATTFAIESFIIEGNTLLPEVDLQTQLQPFLGAEKTAADVEAAREALEAYYREQGWGTVLVSIPQQRVDQGGIRLQVVEGRIGRVMVTGNRFHTRDRILKDLESLQPGTVPYTPDLQREINRINSSRDMEVVPILMPGQQPGTIDVELRVDDRLPVHGSVGLNNRSTHDTEELRLSAGISYDNLWQRGHSIGLQYQVAPQEPDEVEAFSGSYLLNPPWSRDHYLTFYGIVSNSDVATVGSTQTVGDGFIVGTRYIVPLPPYFDYFHNLTVGVDYKDFEEDIDFETAEGFSTPVTYIPFSMSYAGTAVGKSGLTQLRASVNLSLRGLSDQDEFEDKRFKAKANYIYLLAGADRTQRLPAGLELFGLLEGQLSDQPLISNEQYLAGGMDSVRGYKESEITGDNALHWSLELRFTETAALLQADEFLALSLYAFYEGAWVDLNDPLPQEEETQSINGTGMGDRKSVV